MSLFASTFARQLRCARPLFKSVQPIHSGFRQARSKFHTAVSRPSTNVYKAVGIASMALAVASFTTPTIHLDAPPYAPAPTPFTSASESLPPPPASIVNVYELSFGTICGLCAGVFLKKGAKAVAFMLGGVFVLLQYFGSASVLKVDWARMGTRFENLFFTKDAAGDRHAPSVFSLYTWMVDFLTANFQQRASFVAGFALGLRIG